MSGSGLTHQLQADRHAGDIGGAHGIAIHRRGGKGRLLAAGMQVGSEHASARIAERNGFRFQQIHIGQDAPQRFVNRKEVCHRSIPV